VRNHHQLSDLGPEKYAVDGVVGHRYRGRYADHALVIQQEANYGRDIVHRFCAHHASRGAEVWVIDGPSNYASGTDQQAPNPVALGNFVARTTELPVFVLRSNEGAGYIVHALHGFDVFWGAILVDRPLSSTRTAITEPILSVMAESDPGVGVGDGVGAIEEVRVVLDDARQPVLSHPLFSDIILEWCIRQLSNHFNPRWRAA
jgi:hypothetical protein